MQYWQNNRAVEIHAPLPQLDRGTDYESVRRGFESLTAHHLATRRTFGFVFCLRGAWFLQRFDFSDSHPCSVYKNRTGLNIESLRMNHAKEQQNPQAKFLIHINLCIQPPTSMQLLFLEN